MFRMGTTLKKVDMVIITLFVHCYTFPPDMFSSVRLYTVTHCLLGYPKHCHCIVYSLGDLFAFIFSGNFTGTWIKKQVPQYD